VVVVAFTVPRRGGKGAGLGLRLLGLRPAPLRAVSEVRAAGRGAAGLQRLVRVCGFGCYARLANGDSVARAGPVFLGRDWRGGRGAGLPASAEGAELGVGGGCAESVL
jgi:hypothetical protein